MQFRGGHCEHFQEQNETQKLVAHRELNDSMLSTAIPQPTEWQHVADQIDAAMIFTRVDFVNIGSGVVRESEVLHRTIRSYASFLSRDSCEAGQIAIGKTGVVAVLMH